MTTQELIQTFEQERPSLTDDQSAALYSVAYTLYRNGKYKEAKSFFRFLTQSKPFDRKMWMGLGACYQMLKNYTAAVESYSVAAIMGSSDPYVHFHAAECFFHSCSDQKALAALETALELSEKSPKHSALNAQLALLQEAWRKRGAHG